MRSRECASLPRVPRLPGSAPASSPHPSFLSTTTVSSLRTLGTQNTKRQNGVAENKPPVSRTFRLLGAYSDWRRNGNGIGVLNGRFFCAKSESTDLGGMKKGHLGSALPPADPVLHGLGSLGTPRFQSPEVGLPSSAQLALPLFDHLLFSGLCSGFRVPHIAGKAEHRLPKGLRRTFLKHEEVQNLSKFSECVPRGCLRWAIHRQFDK